MDRETLRQTILDGDDRLMSSIIWRHLDDSQQKLIQASRDLWAENTPVTNAALDRLLEIYNSK